jgi:hypothetical protein
MTSNYMFNDRLAKMKNGAKSVDSQLDHHKVFKNFNA